MVDHAPRIEPLKFPLDRALQRHVPMIDANRHSVCRKRDFPRKCVPRSTGDVGVAPGMGRRNLDLQCSGNAVAPGDAFNGTFGGEQLRIAFHRSSQGHDPIGNKFLDDVVAKLRVGFVHRGWIIRPRRESMVKFAGRRAANTRRTIFVRYATPVHWFFIDRSK